MKKWLLLLILFIPFETKALYCSNAELANLKKIAANISYSYDYVETNNEVKFSITLTNLNKDFYIIDKSNNKRYNKTPEVTINNYKSGQVVRYQVNSNTENCQEEILYTLVITLPTYNPFYKDRLCQSIPNYKLCQKWSSHGLNYERFQKNVQSYLDSLKNNPNNNYEEEIIDLDLGTIILNFVLKYYYIPLLMIIIGSSIGIYFVNKRSNIYN